MVASSAITSSIWARVILRWIATLSFAATVLLVAARADAVPSFSRKYGTSCQTCHTHYPVLNPFGEAFRRNGYRFPTQDGGVDSDVAKEETLELGQPEDRSAFPKTVWPPEPSSK